MSDERIHLKDYLLEQEGHDWTELLRPYCPPLPAQFSVFLVTRFLDIFLISEDGPVHWLDAGAASVRRVADSRTDFERKMESEYENWLSIKLVDEAVRRGMTLTAGQCYAFKIPPILGGAYEIDNVEVADLDVTFSLLGDIFLRTKDLPDGTKISTVTIA